MTFSEKVKKARVEQGMTQTELGEKAGVSLRTITAYERDGITPRPKTLAKLAEVLKVSTVYLSDDACENPTEGIEKDPYISEAREKYGSKGALDVEDLLNANKSLFAGGELSEDQKEMFFQAITEAYFACRAEAKKRFSNKLSGKND